MRADGSVVRRKPVIGDVRWDGKLWRRWSGRRWTRAAYSIHPDRLKSPARLDAEAPIDAAGRERVLALAVEDQVVANGATVILKGPHGVVLGYPRTVAHVAHAIMTFFTGGLWVVVWIAVSLGHREDRIRLEADDWGNVWSRSVAGT